MSTSNRKHRRRVSRTFPWMPVVLGLTLIGIASVALAAPRAESPAGGLSSVAPVDVNFAAPNLSLQTVRGETESLADYRDNVVLVNNWATWCPPCKAEMPTLSAYYNAHRSEGFTIIAIEAGDAADEVMQFVENHGLNFPVWLDPDGASLRAFGNGNLPNSYVIDRSGTVRLAWTGEISKAALEEYVTPLLADN